MLDAFDFTIFFLIMVPISQEFGVPLTLVAGTVTFTLWLRLVGAFGSGWLCDRIGRKTPLMISILWYSICNFAAGFAPSFAVLAFFPFYWELAWARNGRPVRRSPWKAGRRARAAS